MGLDMYLHAERYVSGYSFRSKDDQGMYRQVVALVEAGAIVDDETPSARVNVTVGYWRKANAIHRWFVENVQGGVDDCRPYYVSREHLRVLRETCLRVLASSELVEGTVHNGTVYSSEHPQGAVQLEPGQIVADPRVAHELLPPEEGFFFGSTDYDEWYWKGIEETVLIIDRALAASEDDWSFEYQSSW